MNLNDNDQVDGSCKHNDLTVIYTSYYNPNVRFLECDDCGAQFKDWEVMAEDMS